MRLAPRVTAAMLGATLVALSGVSTAAADDTPPRDIIVHDGVLSADGSLDLPEDGLITASELEKVSHKFVEQDLKLLDAIIHGVPSPTPVEDDGKGPVPPVTAATKDCAGGDTESSGRKTYARWKSCIDSGSGPHGFFALQCWKGQFIAHSHANCTVAGQFEIRDPHGKLVSKGNFSGRTDYDRAYVTTFTDPFRFTCDNKPHGRYSFTIKNTQVTLYEAGIPDHGYPQARVPDTTVANTMC